MTEWDWLDELWDIEKKMKAAPPGFFDHEFRDALVRAWPEISERLWQYRDLSEL